MLRSGWLPKDGIFPNNYRCDIVLDDAAEVIFSRLCRGSTFQFCKSI